MTEQEIEILRDKVTVAFKKSSTKDGGEGYEIYVHEGADQTEAQRVMAMAIDLRAQALDTLKRPSPEQQLMEKKGNDSDHTDV